MEEEQQLYIICTDNQVNMKKESEEGLLYQILSHRNKNCGVDEEQMNTTKEPNRLTGRLQIK